MFNLELPDTGVLFVVSGPSGVGKSTLVKAAMARIPGLRFSVSATTRAPRAGEVDGVDYHFLSEERFLALQREGAFLEHAEVYGRRYGTLRAPTQRVLAAGESILLDIDVQGAAQVREGWPEAAHVFILPPSLGELERRLRSRATDREEVIQRRMEQASLQLQGAEEADYIVVNADLTAGKASLQAVLIAEMCRRPRREGAVRRVLDAVNARG